MKKKKLEKFLNQKKSIQKRTSSLQDEVMQALEVPQTSPNDFMNSKGGIDVAMEKSRMHDAHRDKLEESIYLVIHKVSVLEAAILKINDDSNVVSDRLAHQKQKFKAQLQDLEEMNSVSMEEVRRKLSELEKALLKLGEVSLSEPDLDSIKELKRAVKRKYIRKYHKD